MNRIIIIGYLGRNPETRYLQDGTAVTEFSVATSEKWTKDGQQQERTEWFSVVAWGRQAEVTGEYLRKGSRVMVEGKQQTDTWEDKDSGKTMYRTKLRMDRFEFLSAKGDNAGPRPEQSIAGHEDQKPDGDDLDSDIPFAWILIPVGGAIAASQDLLQMSASLIA